MADTCPANAGLKAAYNFREVRAHTKHGPLQRGVLFRCAMAEAGEDDVRTMREVHGIRTIIDLRAPNEAPAEFDDACHRVGVARVRVPLLAHRGVLRELFRRAGAADRVASLWYMATRRTHLAKRLFYRLSLGLEFGWFFGVLVRQEAQGLCDAVQALSECELPAVVCCSQGKDRTGVTVAIALALSGARERDLVADYELSAAAAERTTSRMLRSMTKEVPGLPAETLRAQVRTMAGVDSAAMLRCLDEVRGIGGGTVSGFFCKHGLAPEILSRLVSRLVGHDVPASEVSDVSEPEPRERAIVPAKRSPLGWAVVTGLGIVPVIAVAFAFLRSSSSSSISSA